MDGEYEASFKTDSSMFHVNEANNGMGILTVKNGKMTIHVSLAGKSILNLFSGKAKDAPKNEQNWLKPTEDTVTFSDGSTETVFGFDIPVEKLNTEFDLALIGKKGSYYEYLFKLYL